MTGFTYAGPVNEAGGVALRFTMSSATFAGLHVVYPCANGLRFDLASTAAGSPATTIVIDATSFTATFNGATVTYTPQAPPPAAPTVWGSTTLTSVSASVVYLSAAGLSGTVLGSTAC